MCLSKRKISKATILNCVYVYDLPFDKLLKGWVLIRTTRQQSNSGSVLFLQLSCLTLRNGRCLALDLLVNVSLEKPYLQAYSSPRSLLTPLINLVRQDFTYASQVPKDRCSCFELLKELCKIITVKYKSKEYSSDALQDRCSRFCKWFRGVSYPQRFSNISCFILRFRNLRRGFRAPADPQCEKLMELDRDLLFIRSYLCKK